MICSSPAVYTGAYLPPLINRDLFYDVLRLEVLHRFGGVYTDIDVRPPEPRDLAP